MKITILSKESVLEVAHSALKKANKNDYTAIENICTCIGTIKRYGINKGIRIAIPIMELSEFYPFIRQLLIKNGAEMIVTMPRNTPQSALTTIRNMCENADGYIANFFSNENDCIIIDILMLNKSYTDEMAIDYAIRLL